MSLNDLIATSGSRNFETMRRGWLPTIEERQNRRMKELQIKTTEQTLDYAPTKQRLARQKQENDIRYQDSLMKKHTFDMDQLKTKSDLDSYDKNQKVIGGHLESARSLTTVKLQKEYLQKHKKALLAAGDDEQDAAFLSVMALKGKEFSEKFSMVVKGNKHMQGLYAKRFGGSTTFENFKNGGLKTIMLNDSNYESKVQELLSKGFNIIKTPGLEQAGSSPVGLTGSQKGKTIKDHVEDKTVATNSIRNISGLIDLVKSDSYVGGAAGDVIAGLNSIAAQARQLFGYDSILKSDGSIDKSSVDPDSNVMSKFKKMAINNARQAGALMEMAYLKAKSLDRGGRVTDADFRFAKKMLAAGADKAVIINLLEDNMSRIQDNFNSNAKIYNEEYGQGSTPYSLISRDKILGRDQNNNLSQSLDDEIKKLELELGVK